MANTFQNTSLASGLAELKNFYQGPIVDQFNNEVPIYRGAEKGKHPWSGQVVKRPLRVRRNQGIGATSDGGNLPQIGRQVPVQAEISAKYNYLRFGITAPMIAASKNDVGAFVRSAAYELEQGYEDLKQDVNRQMGWDGTGDLALVNTAAVGSTSLVIKGREDTEPALKFVDVGLQFDIYNGSTLVQAGVTVSAISSGDASSATATLTLDSAVTASAGYVLVRAGSYGQEVQGLLTQLDGATSTVYGLVRADYVQLQGNVVDKNAAVLSLDDWQKAQDEAERRGGIINAIYCDYASRRMYQKLLTADKRYSNTMKGDGGFANKDQSYLEWNGLPIVADKDAPTRIFMLPEKHIEKYILEEMAFADETGSMYIAQSDVDAFEVRIRLFMNMFNAKASASAVIMDYVTP